MYGWCVKARLQVRAVKDGGHLEIGREEERNDQRPRNLNAAQCDAPAKYAAHAGPGHPPPPESPRAPARSRSSRERLAGVQRTQSGLFDA
jgi:hypothetical protein